MGLEMLFPPIFFNRLQFSSTSCMLEKIWTPISFNFPRSGTSSQSWVQNSMWRTVVFSMADKSKRISFWNENSLENIAAEWSLGLFTEISSSIRFLFKSYWLSRYLSLKLVSVDYEIYVKWRTILCCNLQLLQGLLLIFQLFQEKERKTYSELCVVWKSKISYQKFWLKISKFNKHI